MTGPPSMVTVSVLAFGPLSEKLGGREHSCVVPLGSTVRELLKHLELDEWLAIGLTIAINGDRCKVETVLSAGDEIALLPPVSGG